MEASSTSQTHSIDPFKNFQDLASRLKSLLEERATQLKTSGAISPSLMESSQNLLLSMVELKKNHRIMHKKIEAEGEKVKSQKARLETISNYYEGLLYQRSNIEREIINCQSTALDHLNKVQEIQPMIEILGQKRSIQDLEQFDQEITAELSKELSSRQKLKQELESLDEQVKIKEEMVKERKSNLEELPKVVSQIEGHLRKSYSLFFGENNPSKQDLVSIEDSPKDFKIAIMKFYNAAMGDGKTNGITSVSIESKVS